MWSMYLCAELEGWPADERSVFGRLRDAGVRHVALPWRVVADRRGSDEMSVNAWKAGLNAFDLSIAYLELAPLSCLTEDEFEAQTDGACTQMRVAQGMGAGIVGIASGHEGSIVFEMMVAAVTRLGVLAQRLGLCLCVRNRANSALEQLDALGALFRRAKADGVRLCLDNVEFQRAVVNPADAVMSFHNRLGTVRLRDEQGTAPCPLGQGRGHVQATVEALLTEGFAGPIMVDVLGDPTVPPWLSRLIADPRSGAGG